MADLKIKEVDTLPATLADRAMIIYDGQLWIGNSSNVPVPVKGYYVIEFSFDQSGTNTPTIQSYDKNETSYTLTASRVSSGVYRFTFPEDINADGYCYVINDNGTYNEVGSINVKYVNPEGSGVQYVAVTARDYTGSASDMSSTSPVGATLRVEIIA